MALARACLKKPLLQGRSFSGLYPPRSAANLRGSGRAAARYCFPYSSNSSAAATATDHSSQEEKSTQMAVTLLDTGGESSVPSTSRGRGRRGLGLSWRNPWDLIPFHLNDGLGNALMQVSENLNRLLENWSPSRLLGRLKEDDKCYKLRYEVPGLKKEDLRITVEDGMLVITGEAEDEEGGEGSTTEEEDGEGGWYARRYGYYNATLMLPEDAKVEEITAELKDGILRANILMEAQDPRNENQFGPERSPRDMIRLKITPFLFVLFCIHFCHAERGNDRGQPACVQRLQPATAILFSSLCL